MPRLSPRLILLDSLGWNPNLGLASELQCTQKVRNQRQRWPPRKGWLLTRTYLPGAQSADRLAASSDLLGPEARVRTSHGFHGIQNKEARQYLAGSPEYQILKVLQCAVFSQIVKNKERQIAKHLWF